MINICVKACLLLIFLTEYVKGNLEKKFAYLHPNRLLKDLVDNPAYDKRIRPVKNSNTAINITIRFNLYQIIDVNEAGQFLELYLWVTQSWYDEFLTWDPKHYNDISTITLPYDDIWLPDTYVYNSLIMSREGTERWINVLATTNTSTGRTKMKFQYPAIYRFTCKMGIFYFPFDVQNCTIQIGSWTYDSSGLNYFHHGEKVLMEAFVPNEEWEIENFRYTRMIKQYLCCPNPYVWVNANIVIRRKPLHIISTLIIPTIIIAVIAMVGFFMPANARGERTEKVTMGIGTLLAMSILLLNLSHQMPASAESIPLIGWFYLSTILIVGMGTCMTSLMIALENQWLFGKKVPRTIKGIFLYTLGPLVLAPVAKPNQNKPITPVGDRCEFLSDESLDNTREWRHLAVVLDRCLLIFSILAIGILNVSLLFIGAYCSSSY